MFEAEYFKGIKIGEPGLIEESIEVKGDTINSNILFEKKKSTMVQFAFPPEKGLVTNCSQGDIYLNVVSGVVEIDLDGKDMTVKAGEFIVLPKGLPHSVETDEGAKVIFIIVKDD